MTLNDQDRIHRDPKVAGGEAVIKGTRVTLRFCPGSATTSTRSRMNSSRAETTQPYGLVHRRRG